MRRVVVGIDDSLGGAQALRYAVTQARAYAATLVLVRAFGARSPGDASGRAAIVAAATGDVLGIFTRTLGVLPYDLTVQVVAWEGDAGAVLVTVADRESDLLVIGGCGARRFLTGLWSGAVARYCARHAQCPVVIVPPPAMARAGRTERLGRAAARGAEEYLSAAERSRVHPLPGK